MKILKWTLLGCWGLWLLAVCGCNETYAEKKQAMQARWDKSTAAAKVPAIESMLERGQFEQAKKTLLQCIEADPELPPLYVLAGRIHLSEKRHPQARAAFSRAVELNPKLDEAWYLLGSLDVLMKEYPQALNHYQEALTLRPDRSDYIISTADVFIELNQPEQALQLLQKGLVADSRNIDLQLELARLAQRQGDTAQAIRLYEQAEFLNGPRPEILEPAGYAYMAGQQWVNAAEKFQKLLNDVKDQPERYNVTMRSLAICLYNAGRYASALSYYDKLSVVYREDPQIWLNMGYAALGADDPKRAAYCAEQALRHQPTFPQAQAVLGSAFYLQGQYDQSLLAFDKITGDEELAGYAWFMTARCYQQMGRHIQANAAYEQAEKRDPQSELMSVFINRNINKIQ